MYRIGAFLPPTLRSHSTTISPSGFDLAEDILRRASPRLEPWNSPLKKLFGGIEKNSLERWRATRYVLCKILEVSVCDLTDGRRLEAVGEMKNVRWCEGENSVFGYCTIVT